MVQLAEAEVELDAMTKDRDELEAVVAELQEKVTHHLPSCAKSVDKTCAVQCSAGGDLATASLIYHSLGLCSS